MQAFYSRVRIAMAVGHYENFPVGSLLLPARIRPAVHAIYRFARYADDLADEGDATPAQRLAALSALRADLNRIGQGQQPLAEPVLGLVAAIRQHALPLAPFYDLLSAFCQDIVTDRYQTVDELRDYCRRSANPVGRLMLALYGETAPAALAESDAICTALQWINFLQDVAIDWGKGRVYLPAEVMASFAVDRAQIPAATVNAAWCAMMRAEALRAREWLRFGAPLGARLKGRVGVELRLIVAGGERMVSKLLAVNGDVFTRRPRLGGLDWLIMCARAGLPAKGGVHDT